MIPTHEIERIGHEIAYRFEGFRRVHDLHAIPPHELGFACVIYVADCMSDEHLQEFIAGVEAALRQAENERVQQFVERST